MKSKIKILLTTLLMATLLSACSSDEQQVELNAWKEKLKDTTKTHSVDNPMPEIEEKIENAADKVSDKTSSGKDKAQEIGNMIVDKVKEWADTPSDLPTIDNSSDSANVTTSEELSELIEAASGTDKRIHVKFKRVVDGDTIVVTRNGEELPRIRLIGINTPESVHPDETKNVEEGKFASDYLKELMEGIEDVWLEIDIETHDDYGRVLAYVWLHESATSDTQMLNALMVKSGWAEPMTIEPNSKYKDKIAAAAE